MTPVALRELILEETPAYIVYKLAHLQPK